MATAVACARNIKLANVKVVDKYELKVDLYGDVAKREMKKGVAVIITVSIPMSDHSLPIKLNKYRSKEEALSILV